MGSCCCRAQAQNGTEFEEDSERSTRDIIWAVLFIAFWAGSWSYSSLAIQRGDPGLLLYGLDYDGNVCNRNQVRQHPPRLFASVLPSSALAAARSNRIAPLPGRRRP